MWADSNVDRLQCGQTPMCNYSFPIIIPAILGLGAPWAALGVPLGSLGFSLGAPLGSLGALLGRLLDFVENRSPFSE